jgi:hypothetical protein
MTDINKLLDEIERLVPNVSSLEHWQETEGGGEKEFAGEMIPPDRIAVLQALASEYRKHSQQIREAVEALEAAKSAINGLADQQAMSDDHYLSDLAKVESALLKLKKSE